MVNAAIQESERLAALQSLRLPAGATAAGDFGPLVRLAAQCLDTPIVLISIVGEDCQQFLASVGFALQETPRHHSICAHVMEQGYLLEIEDLRLDPRFAHNPFVTGAPHMRFYAGMPLFAPGGQAIGALCVIDTRARRFDDNQRNQLRALAGLVTDRIALRQSIGRRDAVTGLPNRHQMVADLDVLKTAGHRGSRSLVLLEIIGLAEAQEISQAVGLDVIDSLVRHAALRAQRALPPGVALYHVGVTRLAFWHDPAAEPDLPAHVAAALNEPLTAAGLPLQLRISGGLADFDHDSVDPGDLLRKAMAAQHDRPSPGGTALRRYDAGRDALARRRHQLALDLRHALERDEFHLVYQPRLELGSGRLSCVEALIRWRHPRHGAVGPAEFIPVIERTAMMQPLTLWVVERSLRELARWPGIRLSLNLSPRDFDNGRLAAAVLALCQRHGVAPARLEFEVTEGEWLHGSDSVLRQMNALVAAGATIAIDDFGAGYSNFAYMNLIPATVLKIDQSLVRDVLHDPRREILVREILSLARQLRYRTVAEGVESQAVGDFVAACGCDEVQGYFFSPPLEAGELAAFIDAHGRARPAGATLAGGSAA